MISVDDAIAIITEYRPPVSREPVPLPKALGRTLARDYHTPFPLPIFDNSAMDGYAVGSDTGPWNLIGEVTAGGLKVDRIQAGEAVRIFTGAPVPAQTYGVIAQEDAVVEDSCLHGKVSRDGHIRHQGEECPKDSLVLKSGEALTPPRLAALASMGIDVVDVESTPIAAIISTGTELMQPGQEIGIGQIYDSNSTGLAAALRDWWISTTVHYSPDTESDLLEAFMKCKQSADILVTSGGISVGDYDFARVAAEKAGFEVHFHGVAMKPGKPIAFGTDKAGKAWFGLPGNPMSAWTGLLIFVAQYLGRTLSQEEFEIATSWVRKAGREEFVPVIVNQCGKAQLVPAIGSHANFGLNNAHGLARIPATTTEVRKGDKVKVLLLPWRSQT